MENIFTNSIIILIFIICYACIAFEESLKMSKTAFALLAGIVCWTLYFVGNPAHTEENMGHFSHHFSKISEILFFLLGAMTIVEIMDSHHSFRIITRLITTHNKVRLLWIASFLCFFMSSVLDNLTTSIVMISLLRKILKSKEDLKFYGGMVVIAANAGGAWTPIGDVTTTMLWIGNQISSGTIMQSLFIPSVVSMVVPLGIISIKMKGDFEFVPEKSEIEEKAPGLEKHETNKIFILGVGSLVFVPIFKTLTGMPPFMGILLGLASMWILVEILHNKKEEHVAKHYSIKSALEKTDVPSVLFFLGILLAISCLETTGMLHTASEFLSKAIPDNNMVIFLIGLLSAIIDNVPLVAACQGMYSLDNYPLDDNLWIFLAYAAGTGGSILIIGSAAGVAVMGMAKIDFMWYFKKISIWAFIGYVAGALAYLYI